MKRFMVLVLFLAIGCATERPQGKTEAEVLFKEAQELKEDGHFLMATEKLNTIRSQFPYSFYATGAELLQAEIFFEQENYVEAAAAFILFRDFHPKHPKIPYVVWKIGESHYRQLPSTFDRDLSSAHEAMKYFEELILKYPNSEYVKKAKENIANCHRLLRKKEKYIADFYFKTEVFDAARYRYLYILKKPIFDQEVKDHYIRRVLLSSLHLNEKEKCLQHYSQLYTMMSDPLKEESGRIKKRCEKIVARKEKKDEQ